MVFLRGSTWTGWERKGGFGTRPYISNISEDNTSIEKCLFCSTNYWLQVHRQNWDVSWIEQRYAYSGRTKICAGSEGKRETSAPAFLQYRGAGAGETSRGEGVCWGAWQGSDGSEAKDSPTELHRLNMFGWLAFGWLLTGQHFFQIDDYIIAFIHRMIAID